MKYVTEELNGLANDTDLPIITGAQFNKNVNYLYDVSELAIREADDITHVGALILGIFNNDVNLMKAQPDPESLSEDQKAKIDTYSHPNTFYVEVLKNRFGTPGIGFNMAYNGKLQTLGNYNNGLGIIKDIEDTKPIKAKISLQKATKPERLLTKTAKLKRVKEWAKDHATEGVNIEEGIKLFIENNPNIEFDQTHEIAYNSTYKTTAANQERQQQIIQEKKVEQTKMEMSTATLQEGKKELTIEQQENKASDWGKKCATNGTTKEKGLELFKKNNPGFEVEETHEILYNYAYTKTIEKTNKAKSTK
jgi:hypothetical protein